MLMARKNSRSALGDPKNSLIKFNEQIASKYRAGLSFRYLDKYLGDAVCKHIANSMLDNKEKQVSRKDFEATLKEIQVRILIGSLNDY
jgi:hypothetical protein